MLSILYSHNKEPPPQQKNIVFVIIWAPIFGGILAQACEKAPTGRPSDLFMMHVLSCPCLASDKVHVLKSPSSDALCEGA